MKYKKQHHAFASAYYGFLTHLYFSCLCPCFMVAAETMLNIDLAASVTKIAVAFVPMLLGIVCHEVAHGWVAYKLGDPTAKSMGRLTLNPIPHIDPMGIAMFILTALTSPFIIGWAKPVPVDTRWLRNPRRDMILVSAAGPVTNFILALLFAAGYSLAAHNPPMPGTLTASGFDFWLSMCATGMWINLTLGWFNLMPFPPLDGSKIVSGLLPLRLAYAFQSYARYGFVLVILLLATGMLGTILRPLIDGSASIITYLVALT